MIGPAIPEGPTWAVATLLVGGLLLAVVREFLKRRPNGSSKMGERLAALEAKVAMFDGAGAISVAGRLAALEVTLGSNTLEIGRLRDWKHDELTQQLQSIEGRLANFGLDIQELRANRRE